MQLTKYGVLTDWQHIMTDARLNSVVERALTSNRDLQEAIAVVSAGGFNRPATD